MKIELNVTETEAKAMRDALDFVQGNSRLVASSRAMIFQTGKLISFSISQWLGLGYIIAKVDSEIRRADADHARTLEVKND